MHEGFTRVPPSWSAFRSNTFGYSRMIVHNSTHVHWQQVSTDPTSFPLSEYGRSVIVFSVLVLLLIGTPLWLPSIKLACAKCKS